MADFITATTPTVPPTLPTQFDKWLLWNLRMDTMEPLNSARKVVVQATLKKYGLLDDQTMVLDPITPPVQINVPDFWNIVGQVDADGKPLFPATAAVIPEILDAIIELGTAQGKI